MPHVKKSHLPSMPHHDNRNWIPLSYHSNCAFSVLPVYPVFHFLHPKLREREQTDDDDATTAHSLTHSLTHIHAQTQAQEGRKEGRRLTYCKPTSSNVNLVPFFFPNQKLGEEEEEETNKYTKTHMHMNTHTHDGCKKGREKHQPFHTTTFFPYISLHTFTNQKHEKAVQSSNFLLSLFCQKSQADLFFNFFPPLL